MAKRKRTKAIIYRKLRATRTPTYNLGWSQGLRTGYLFLLHMWHPSCLLFKTGGKSWMKQGPVCNYDKCNISVVISDHLWRLKISANARIKNKYDAPKTTLYHCIYQLNLSTLNNWEINYTLLVKATWELQSFLKDLWAL